MVRDLKLYYIPKNNYIKNDKIYTFYLNKAKNLDLTTILGSTSNISEINISIDDYNAIVKLVKEFSILSNNNKKLIEKLIKVENNNE